VTELDRALVRRKLATIEQNLVDLEPIATLDPAAYRNRRSGLARTPQFQVLPAPALITRVRQETPTRVPDRSARPMSAVYVMTSVSGLSFDEAWRAHIEGAIEGVRVPILDRASFIRNKRASGRQKDLADLELLGADDPS
jgi:hypothetical protein